MLLAFVVQSTTSTFAFMPAAFISSDRTRIASRKLG
jgi:hypothetical protein